MLTHHHQTPLGAGKVRGVLFVGSEVPRYRFCEAGNSVLTRTPLFCEQMSAARVLLASVRLGRVTRGPFAAVSRRSIAAKAVLEDLVTSAGAAPAAEPARPAAVHPADADRQNFELHWSVDMWRDFNPREWLQVQGIGDDSAPLPTRLAAFVETLTNLMGTSGALGSTEAARFWAYHVARSGFFATQAILGLAAVRAAVQRDAGSDSAVTRMDAVARSGWQGPLAEAMLQYYQDYENVKEGRYALPWDMTTPTHRQFNP